MLREIKRTIFEHEGGPVYTNDPDDPGGATRWGISQRDHRGVDIEHLSLDEAVKIYIEKYWKPLNLDAIDAPMVRFKVFDLGVNLGVVRAAMMLQRAVGVLADGYIGPATIRAVNATSSDSLLLKLAFAQQDRYAEIVARDPRKAKFLKGWIRRSHDLGEGIESEPEAI